MVGGSNDDVLPQRQVERAKIILLAAAGKHDIEIAAALRIDRQRGRTLSPPFFSAIRGWLACSKTPAAS